MKPVAPVRKTFNFGLPYSNPWTARTRLKDILRVIVWARDNGVKVRRLRQDQINDVLSRQAPDLSNKPRLRIYRSDTDE